MIDLKQDLRRRFMQRRSESAQSTKLNIDLLIQRIQTVFSPKSGESVHVGLYHERGDEFPATWLEACRGFEAHYPRVEGDQLQFFASTSVDHEVGSFNILEPKADGEPRPANKMDLVFVPGVAFDLKGGRLGYGKGFYDRALAGFTGPKIGICFHSQVSDQALPQEETDEVLDYLLPENYLVDIAGPKRSA